MLLERKDKHRSQYLMQEFAELVHNVNIPKTIILEKKLIHDLRFPDTFILVISRKEGWKVTFAVKYHFSGWGGRKWSISMGLQFM